MNEKIIQIMPAAGWYAVYEVEGEDHHERLACWALCKDGEGNTYIDGYSPSDDGCTHLCTEDNTFTNFIHESDIPKMGGVKV